MRANVRLPGEATLFSSPGNGNEEPLLNEVDARVLQSMLQDEKLNLQEEENMKRLLERGVKADGPVAQEAKRAKEEAMEEKEYSSKVLQKLGKTKLWKGLSRNAADLFESAKIWVENKVERDTKLIAGLGIFAFERALNDVKRALPATASVVDKVAPKKFLLDSSSSFNDQEDIRRQMATPQDEIKAVTQALKLIIQSGGESRSGGTSRRGLQSTASSKQGKDRFLKAYQRRKQTTLKREKENLAQSSMRMAGSVMDSAYQVKRELEIEPNQPGYKTRALREGAAQTSKRLASGAAGFLSGAKAAAQAALSEGKSATPESLPPSTIRDDGMAATNAALDAAMRQATPAEEFIEATVVETPSYSSVDAPINSRIPGTSSEFYNSRGSAYTQQPGEEVSTTSDQDMENLFFASREGPSLEMDKGISSLLDETGGAYFAQGIQETAPTLWTPEPEIVEAVWEIQAGGSGAGAPPNQYFSDIILVDDDEDEEDFIIDEDPEEALRKVIAEIVSDDEFDEAFGQAKQVTEVEEFEDEYNRPSIWTQITLRVLDVVFLIIEKLLLVSFKNPSPCMLSAGVWLTRNTNSKSRRFQACLPLSLALQVELPGCKMKEQVQTDGKRYQMLREEKGDTR